MEESQQSLAQQIQTSSRRNIPPPTKREVRQYEATDLVPTGSTLLNLACSDNPYGGYGLGKIVTLPGTSQGGKTLLMLSTFAESNKMKHLDEYQFVYDDVEAALEFDVGYLFGKQTEARIVDPPQGNSDTIEHFKSNIVTLAAGGKPFIYCLDSFDALSSDAELEKEMRKALAMAKSEEAAKKIAGSYGTEKAKIAGQVLRMIKQELKRTNSLLIMIQQIRQNINTGPFGDKWTTAGGEAPFFYSTHQVWLTKVGQLKNKDRKIGTEVVAKVKKNKLTGKEREVPFKVYYDYGIDDVCSCIDFMLDEGFWKKGTKEGEKTHIKATELDLSMNKNDLIHAIEEDPKLQEEMVKAVHVAWKEIEDEIKLDRKPKYE